MVALFGALLAWIQRPKPNFVLSHIIIDDNSWRDYADPVTAYAVVVNHGDAPALDVTLWVTHQFAHDGNWWKRRRHWVRTAAADYWAAMPPGHAIQRVEHTHLAKGNSAHRGHDDARRFMAGAGGYAKFDGRRLRVKWRNGFGVMRKRTWNLDVVHRKLGRSTLPIPVTAERTIATLN